jgi:hypothetical protein
MDRFLRDTHPSATTAETVVRLACVKHAASVRSEPGSNSQVHPSQATKMTQLKQTDPKPNQLIPTSLAKLSPSPKAKRRKCTDQWNTLSENIRLAHKLRYTDKRPQTASSQSSLKTNPQTNLAQHHITYVSQRKLHKGAANISLPIPDSTFKEQTEAGRTASVKRLLGSPKVRVNAMTRTRLRAGQAENPAFPGFPPDNPSEPSIDPPAMREAHC